VIISFPAAVIGGLLAVIATILLALAALKFGPAVFKWWKKPKAPPAAASASAKLPIQCGAPPPPTLTDDQNLGDVDWAWSVHGGDIVGRTIRVSGLRRMDRDTRLIATGDIVIDGMITTMSNPLPSPSPSLDVISIGGTVTISGKIWSSPAPTGADVTVTDQYAQAAGKAAERGGYVRITAVRIVVPAGGSVRGTSGGDGGNATATGQRRALFFGGLADAVGGPGGPAGDVVLCARDLIDIDGQVEGAFGGSGGWAQANAANSSPSSATGGTAQRGGDILITGTTAGSPCRLRIGGSVVAGVSGGGGIAKAAVTSAALASPGGNANATAPPSMAGGNVIIVNCTTTVSGKLEGGAGMPGSNAHATGGPGAGGMLGIGGGAGGDAIAAAGNGGPGGKVTGATATAAATNSSGGDTWTTAGTGGTGGRWSAGGASGTHTATPGKNGAGLAPNPATSTAAAAPAAPGSGGAGGAGSGPLWRRGAP
jgi:hypothetical protein